ncbi:MAG TPA: hypothetical protein VIO11_01020 [Candidatus Methanoperedens sp.]
MKSKEKSGDRRMELIIKLITVLVLGAFEIWIAVPAGLALEIHPLLAGVMAAAGAILGVVIILAVGEHMRAWLIRKRSGENKRHGQIYRIWMRYGVAGLGLLSPPTVGAPLGTALGLAFGAPPGRLLFWMSLGIILLSLTLSIAGMIGIAGIEALRK